MEMNRQLLATTFLAGLLLASPVSADAPSFVTFTNETSLSLATSIAGLPGYGIDANITKAVPFNIVSLGCNYKQLEQNCPIEFIDKQNGEKVATVYINSITGTLNGQPIFYGNYALQYEVLGWEQSPINHITISKKEVFA